MTIGSDANFSWASTDGISSVGKVVLRTTDDDVFGDVVSGTGGLTKQGEGRLTLARSQTYSGGTSVEGGTLVIPHGVTLANTASFRNNGEVVFDSLDALGTGSISGDGRFTLSGSIDLDASRIAGNPCFEVLPDAALAVNAPSFGSRSEVRLDDGSTATLGGGFVDTVEGFMGFVTSGTAKTVDGELVLTPNESGKAGSAFYTRRVKVTEPWSVSFTYQAGEHGDWTEDVLGAAFILQNADEGPALLETTAASAGCNVAKSFGALIRLGIDADCNDRWGFINGGRVEDANSARTLAIAASAGHELVVEVTYDGTKLHTKFTCNGNSRERDWTMDPAALLGSGFAWVGFTGATSASTGCAQTIRNFRFTGGSAVTLSINETDWVHSKYAPTYTTVDGQPAFQLTTNESSKRSATWHKTRINVSRPFTASFKYRVPAHSESAADGFSIAIQNYGANAGDCYGADGGAMGIVYGTPRANTVAWGVNLYQTQSFKFVLDGAWNGDPVPMTEWDMADGNDTEFTLTYDLKTLTLTATRSGFDVTASREVDLLDKTGGAGTAWIGFTGGTGGSSAEQLVYDFTFAYGAVDNSRYANPFVVDGAVTLNLGQGAIGFADLTLLDGTVLSATSSYSGAALELGGTKLVGNATVSCVETSPIVLQDTIYFTENAGVLKLVGDVRANGKVKLDISSIKGVRNLLDLSEATTAITTDDFEVTGAVRPPVRLDIQNGILRAWRDVSTVLIFR